MLISLKDDMLSVEFTAAVKEDSDRDEDWL